MMLLSEHDHEYQFINESGQSRIIEGVCCSCDNESSELVCSFYKLLRAPLRTFATGRILILCQHLPCV